MASVVISVRLPLKNFAQCVKFLEILNKTPKTKSQVVGDVLGLFLQTLNINTEGIKTTEEQFEFLSQRDLAPTRGLSSVAQSILKERTEEEKTSIQNIEEAQQILKKQRKEI